MLGIEPELSVCMVSTLLAVLSLWLPHNFWLSKPTCSCPLILVPKGMLKFLKCHSAVMLELAQEYLSTPGNAPPN